MSETLIHYQAKVQELKQWIRHMDDLSTKVRNAAAVLSRWREAMVSNAPNNKGYPAEVGLRRDTPTINGSEWPKIEDIHDGLVQYHQLVFEVQKAYDAIPSEQRAVVQPPAVLLKG